MSISLLINGQTQRFTAETISVGRGHDNTISLPDDERLAAAHAVLRAVAGRWIIESKEGGPVRVGKRSPYPIRLISPEMSFTSPIRGPKSSSTPVAHACRRPSVRRLHRLLRRRNRFLRSCQYQSDGSNLRLCRPCHQPYDRPLR